eukprot:703769-Prorocentrum_minimum.AAC.1
MLHHLDRAAVGSGSDLTGADGGPLFREGEKERGGPAQAPVRRRGAGGHHQAGRGALATTPPYCHPPPLTVKSRVRSGAITGRPRRSSCRCWA